MILNTLSFELRIMVRKRRMNLEQHKKGVRRKLYFTVPAQEAKGGQPLAPILGQLQVSPHEFCTQFNTKTKDYQKGMLMFVELIVNWDKTFIINLNSFPISVLMQNFLYFPISYLKLKEDLDMEQLEKSKRKQEALLFSANRVIGISDIFQLALMYQQITGVANIQTCFRTVYSCLLSYKINVSPYTESEYLNYIHGLLEQATDTFFLIESNCKGYGLFNFHLESSYALLISSSEDDTIKFDEIDNMSGGYDSTNKFLSEN